MPLFEGCCSNSTIDRKKSAAYAPSMNELEKDNYQPISPSTSQHTVKLSPKQKSSCCSHRETNGNENSTVLFNEGLSTGSTEMLYATKFYQNCVDEDTESRWMEAYEEQKNFEQTSHGSSKDKELITSKLSTRSAMEMDRSKFGKSSAFLEKTHSAEPKGGNFRPHLQRCHEMENIDKVTQHG